MPNLSTEKLEKILDEKLGPLSEQLKEVLAMVKSLSTKYEKMEESLRKQNSTLEETVLKFGVFLFQRHPRWKILTRLYFS